MFLHLLAAIVLIAMMPATPPGVGAPPVVIFVCEHGAAKSVIATAYFNKMAADRHLPYRAAFRGVNPPDEPDRIVHALRPTARLDHRNLLHLTRSRRSRRRWKTISTNTASVSSVSWPGHPRQTTRSAPERVLHLHQKLV
jgi:hypothetical protein